MRKAATPTPITVRATMRAVRRRAPPSARPGACPGMAVMVMPPVGPALPGQPRVAVEPAEEQVAEVGEQGGREADQQEERRPPAAPAADDPGVEVGRVD